MITVKLKKEKTIVTRPVEEKVFAEIKVQRVVDNYQEKKVVAHINEIGQVVLWEKEAYDAIGQWTDKDVEKRINELYN